MNKFIPLLRIQLLGLFNFNKIKYNQNPREKRTAIWLLIGAVLFMIIMEGYLFGLVIGWSYLGLTESIPALLLIINVAIFFILTFMKSSGTLFGFSDYDLIVSLPISSRQLIASRLLPTYLMNVFFSFFSFFLPMIPFWYQGYFSFASLIMTLFALVVIPLIPMIAAMVIGIITAIIARRFRYANLFIVILSLLFLLGLMFSSIFVKNIDLKQLTNFSKLIDQTIQRTYPFANWLNSGIVDGNWPSFAAFFSLSLICGVLFFGVLEKFYLSLNSALFSSYNSKVFRWGSFKRNSPLMALYKREWQLYLSSPVYVMNTSLGSVMLISLSIALLFFPLNKIETMLHVTTIETVLQPYLFLLPVVLSVFLIIGTTTSSSISMEGKNYWQLSVLPIRLTVAYLAKLFLNLTIVLPAILVSGIVLTITFNIRGLDLLFLFLLPTAYSLYSELVGLLMDCLYAKFDWTNPQQIVKQSFANLLTLVINFLSILLGIASLLLFSSYYIAVLSLLTLFLFSSSLYLYKHIIHKNPFSTQ